jgi:hypothetical protein
MGMSRHKLFLVGLAVVLILATVLGVNRVYDWRFEFVAMPPTDEELRRWLASQPGVEAVEVWRDGDELRIRYRVRIWRTGPEYFTPPWERFGYKGFILLDGTALSTPQSSEMTSRLGWGW